VRVLAIDPGGTSGLAYYATNTVPAQDLDEIPGGTEGFIKWWKGSEKFFRADVVICESFRLDGRTEKPDLTPVEIIGFLKGTDYDVVFQTPAQAKSLITNDVLKRAGLYPKRGSVKGGHGVDALRHALYYLAVTVKHRETIELLFPKEDADV
jgi:hypothetical protein